MTQLALVPARTAVLSMDMQSAIVSVYAKDRPDLLERAAGVLKEARRLGMTIIHVRVGFRPKLPEVSSRNPLFAAIKNSPQHRAIFEGAGGEIHPAVAPQADDITVVKHRVSAFAGTDLEMILRAHDIDTLVLFGIATSGVVLSTLLEACDADYRLIVIADCCTDQDAALHACLIEKLFPRRATVLTAGEFLGALAATQHAPQAQSE
jgi:nicotinamidase-related amidase